MYRDRIFERDGRAFLLRDDGYRITVRLLSGFGANVDPEEWILWAEYKHCDFPIAGSTVADLLMQDFSIAGSVETTPWKEGDASDEPSKLDNRRKFEPLLEANRKYIQNHGPYVYPKDEPSEG